MEKEFYERIIMLQQEQIKKYDEYIRLFIHHNMKKPINETKTKCADDITDNLYHAIDVNMKTCDEGAIMRHLQQTYPAVDRVSTIVYDLIFGTDNNTSLIKLDKLYVTFLDNNENKTLTLSKFAELTSLYIFEVIKPLVEEKNIKCDNDYDLDSNRVQNLLLLKDEKYYIKIFKLIYEKIST